MIWSNVTHTGVRQFAKEQFRSRCYGVHNVHIEMRNERSLTYLPILIPVRSLTSLIRMALESSLLRHHSWPNNTWKGTGSWICLLRRELLEVAVWDVNWNTLTAVRDTSSLKPRVAGLTLLASALTLSLCEVTDKFTDYSVWSGILAWIISARNSMRCINIVYRDICTHFSEQTYNYSASFTSRFISSLFCHANYLYVVAIIAISLELVYLLRHIVSLHNKRRYAFAETL